MKQAKRFKPGDRVIMTNDALANYGTEYDAVVFRVSNVSTFYCPAAVHFANDGHTKTCNGHPGYDDAGNSALYDLEREDGDTFHSSLYDWELEGES
jgi:hypothetical protein